MEARRRTGSQASVRQPAPNPLWTSDITDLWSDEGWLHLAIVLGMTCSMSRKGNGWDNAPTEIRCNRSKNERVHGVRTATHAETKATAFECIEDFYNRKRQHSTLGYKPPVPFLENWISEQQQEKLVA